MRPIRQHLQPVGRDGHARDRERWRVVLVVGTRPEAVKMAPVHRALGEDCRFDSKLVTTGQHGEVVDEALRTFQLGPDVALTLPRDSGTLGELNARLLTSLDRALPALRPDVVIVQGDTASTLAGALSAFWRGIPVVHLEAGLRTGDLTRPFPEEANRRLVTQVSRLHLAPTESARDALLAEGVPGTDVVVTGNTVVDALLWAAARREPLPDPRLDALETSPAPLVLVTAHRRESWGAGMEAIGRAVARVALAAPEAMILVVTHPNPAVSATLADAIGRAPNVMVTAPLAYGPFARLLARATVVLSDSGGIQEEAPSFGVPVLVMRETTERPEGIEAGLAELVGTDEHKIAAAVRRHVERARQEPLTTRPHNPYGDGHAAARSVEAVAALLAGTGVSERQADSERYAVGAS